MKCRILCLVVPLVFSLLTGCSVDQPVTSTPPEIVALDTLLARMNTSANAIKTAPTTLLKQEILAGIPAETQALLNNKWIAIDVTINDIQMHNSSTAKISISAPSIPTYESMTDKEIRFALTSPIYLSITADQARLVRPGHKLHIEGPMSYQQGSMMALAIPDKNRFALLHFRSDPMKLGILSLSPKTFRIFAAPPSK